MSLLFLFLLVVHPSILGLVVLGVLSRHSCLHIPLIWVGSLAVKLVRYRDLGRLGSNFLLKVFNQSMGELVLVKFEGKGQHFQNSKQLAIFDLGLVHIMFYGPGCVCDPNLQNAEVLVFLFLVRQHYANFKSFQAFNVAPNFEVRQAKCLCNLSEHLMLFVVYGYHKSISTCFIKADGHTGKQIRVLRIRL